MYLVARNTLLKKTFASTTTIMFRFPLTFASTSTIMFRFPLTFASTFTNNHKLQLTLLLKLQEIKLSTVCTGPIIVKVHVLSMFMIQSMFMLRVHVPAACLCPCWMSLSLLLVYVYAVHCGKKDRKFPSQITDAADHNKPVTENSGIKIPTSLSDCSAINIGIFFLNIFRN